MACYWVTGCEIISCSLSLAVTQTHSHSHTYPQTQTNTHVCGVVMTVCVKSSLCLFTKESGEEAPWEPAPVIMQRPVPCMLPCPGVIQHLSVGFFSALFCYVLACLIYSMTWIYKPCFIRLVTWQTHACGGLIPLHSLFLPSHFVGQFDSLLLWLNGVILCCMSLNISRGMLRHYSKWQNWFPVVCEVK